MNFTSTVFLVFLPLVILIHWLLPHKARWIFLLLSSYFFYGYLNFLLLPLFLSTTLVSYFCSIGISKTEKKGLKKFFLFLSCFFMLGVLFIFKYLDFTLSNITGLLRFFGSDVFLPQYDLILPVGISFYTFQTMSYVIDVYRGEYPCETHFGYYALFVSFFPQLVAGPIESPKNLLPQLKKERRLDASCFSDGFYYLVRGYVKKVVVADFLGLFVAQAYSHIESYSGVMLLVATVFFAFQIYGDFSGYSDIAMGSSRMMGIQLSENFDHPYLSHSLKEFYRRWHISLNRWFTSYLYIPLGGSRKGKARRILNVLIVFLCSGLWHGAKWNYVIWGGLSGIIVVLETLLGPRLSACLLTTEKRKKIWSAVSVFLTFLIVCGCWVFFRADSLSDAALVYQRIFTSFFIGEGASYFQDVLFTSRVLFSLLSLVLLLYLPKLDFSFRKESDTKEFSLSSLLYVSLVLLIGFSYVYQLSTTGESGFIYFQF